MSTPKEEPASFREQLEQKGQVTKTLVSIAVLLGAGRGYVKAHTTPVVKAIKAKIDERMPEAVVYMSHAYRHSAHSSYEEESDNMAARAVEKAGRRVFQAATA